MTKQKTYKMEFTEREHRLIEKVMDNMASLNNEQIHKFLHHTQFGLKVDKLKIDHRKAGFNLFAEYLRSEEVLRSIRNKFEAGYKSGEKEQ